MNYIEFKIGGKVRGFKIGLGCLGDILDHYDIDMVGFGQKIVKNQFSAIPVIMYYAHVHDCKRKGISIDFTLENVQDWIDEVPKALNNENIVNLIMILLDSVKKHLPQAEESKGEDSKKK